MILEVDCSIIYVWFRGDPGIVYLSATLNLLSFVLLMFTTQHQTIKTFRMYYFILRNDKFLVLYFTFCNWNFNWRRTISPFCCQISSEYLILCINDSQGEETSKSSGRLFFLTKHPFPIHTFLLLRFTVIVNDYYI